MDVSWFEITGYIDDKFEITVQTRGSWSDVNTGIYTGEALEEKRNSIIEFITSTMRECLSW